LDRDLKSSGDEEKKTPEGGLRKRTGCWTLVIWLVILALVAPWLIQTFLGTGASGGHLPYTSFREQLAAGNVERIIVRGEMITGYLIEPVELPNQETGETIRYEDFTTYLPSFGDEQLMGMLQEHNVMIETRPEENFAWGAILISVLPFLLLIGLAFFFLRNMRGADGGGVLSMTKSRARLYDRTQEGVTFADVAGSEGTKRELEEVVQFLKASKKFQRLGGTIPRGVLLVGPPGTGKTLLARAVAGEANVPFFSITGSDFMEMFVGVGASRVRDLFKEAKKNSPSIIFIDELDSIGRRRGAGMGGGHDEREQTLNQMLSEMDGFERNENVIIMAATNRPDILDPALLRPGRFDRRITVDLPTLYERVEILKIHAENKPLAEDVDLEKIARGTPGFSGADLANILNEAALLAARKDKDQIDNDDINEARDKVLMGLERENMTINEKERKLLAYHEAGHAVVAAVLPNTDPVHKVTIVPRGQAMGVTQQLPEGERYLYPREYMLDRLAVMMGGRAAEELFFKTATSGAENDLKQATKLARKMVLDWGMSKRLGHMAFGGENEEVFLGEDLAHRREYSENTSREIDQEVKAILDEAFKRATRTLEQNKKGTDSLVEALLDREQVSGDEVLEILMLPQRNVLEQ
jgi:cell division protease FtsH